MDLIDRLTDLAECLCTQIREMGLPTPCFCGVVPGDAPVASYAGNCSGGQCGMAWVRLQNMYPSAGLGVPVETPGECGFEMTAAIELGVLRCYQAMDNQGNSVSDAVALAGTTLMLRDELAMRRAVMCCPSLSSKDYLLRFYRTVGPQGGLLGSTWQLDLAV